MCGFLSVWEAIGDWIGDGRGEDCAVAEFRGGYGVGRARERSGGDGYRVESRREGDCELRRGEDWE